MNSHPETTDRNRVVCGHKFWRGLCRRTPEPLPTCEPGSRKKALTVSAKRRKAVVIGVDQFLACDGQLFDKLGRRTGVSLARFAVSPLSPPPIWLMRQAGASFGYAHAAITGK